MIQYTDSIEGLTPDKLEATKHLPAIDLCCDHEMQGYYERFGMVRSVGMMIRRY